MPVTDVHEDHERFTLAVTTELDAPVDRVWELWSDPEQLQRWWGPPGYPATVLEHALTPGGQARWYLTSPEGDEYHGWWRVVSVDLPHTLQIEGGFAHDDGRPNDHLPVIRRDVELVTMSPKRTRMTMTTRFRSQADMTWMYRLGARGSLELAVRQLDALVAESDGS